MPSGSKQVLVVAVVTFKAYPCGGYMKQKTQCIRYRHLIYYNNIIGKTRLKNVIGTV